MTCTRLLALEAILGGSWVSIVHLGDIVERLGGSGPSPLPGPLVASGLLEPSDPYADFLITLNTPDDSSATRGYVKRDRETLHLKLTDCDLRDRGFYLSGGDGERRFLGWGC